MQRTVTVELAIIVPTLNEVGNVRPLFERIGRAFDSDAWEIVYVDDDSIDGTGDELRRLARENDRVRVIHRIGRSGLSSACIEGILATETPFVAVIDADLQHDETLLPTMLEVLKSEDVEIVVGSRFLEGGSAEGLSSSTRERMSLLARRISRIVTRMPLTDPMSGFFMLRRELFDEAAHGLTARGYKILLDILATVRRPVPVRELPFHFRARHSGKSKLDVLVSLEFLMLVLDKLFRGWIPVGFMLYVMVGLGGLAVHLTLLGLLFRIGEFPFMWSQAIATIVAMTVNFHLNNIITFRERRLGGWLALRGLATFYAACSIGAVINVTVAQFLFDRGVIWFLAGFSGAVVGAVWNYGMNATFTWRKR
ncbi:MAG: glycosyltransferase family 2 protein [Alphaproteobacteria bacterium]|nr:glycosyltransferase family 2 protein [Alphaproteobacteria bacterium]